MTAIKELLEKFAYAKSLLEEVEAEPEIPTETDSDSADEPEESEEFDFLFSGEDENEPAKSPLEQARDKMLAARTKLTPAETSLMHKLEISYDVKLIKDKAAVGALSKSPTAENLSRKGFLIAYGKPPTAFKLATVEDWAKSRGISLEKEAKEITPHKYNTEHSSSDVYRPLEKKLTLETAIPLVDTKIKFTNFINDYFTNRKVFYRTSPEVAVYRGSSNAFTNNQDPKDSATKGNPQLAEIIKEAIEIFRQTPFVKSINSSSKPITVKVINDALRYSTYKAWRIYYIIADISGNSDGTTLKKSEKNAIFASAKKKLKDFRTTRERSDLNTILNTFKDTLKDLNLPASLIEGAEIKLAGDSADKKARSASSKSDEEFILSNTLDPIYKAIILSIVNYYTKDSSSEESVASLCEYINNTLHFNLDLLGSNRPSPVVNQVTDREASADDRLDWAASQGVDYDEANPETELNVDGYVVASGSTEGDSGLDITRRGKEEDDEISNDLFASLTDTFDLFADLSSQKVNIAQIDSLEPSKLSGNVLLSIFYQIMNKIQTMSSDNKYKFPIQSNGTTSYLTVHEVLEKFITYLKASNKWRGEFPEEILINAITKRKMQKKRESTEVFLESDPNEIEQNIINVYKVDSEDVLQYLPKFLLSITDGSALNKNVNIDILQAKKQITEAVDLNLQAYKNAKNKLDSFTLTELPGLKVLTLNNAIKQQILEKYSSNIQEILNACKEVFVLPTKEKTNKFKTILDSYFSVSAFDAFWNVKVGISKKLIKEPEQESKILELFPQSLGFLLLPAAVNKSDLVKQITAFNTLADALSQDTQEASEEDTQKALASKEKEVEDNTSNLALKNFALLISSFTKFLPSYTSRIVKALNYCYYKVIISGDPEPAVSTFFNAVYHKEGKEWQPTLWPQEYLKISNQYAAKAFNALEEIFRLAEDWDVARDDEYLTDELGEKYFRNMQNYEDFISNKKAVLPTGSMPLAKDYISTKQIEKAPESEALKESNIYKSINWLRNYLPK